MNRYEASRSETRIIKRKIILNFYTRTSWNLGWNEEKGEGKRASHVGFQNLGEFEITCHKQEN